MHSTAAIQLALKLVAHPAAAKTLARGKLPAGTGLLLKIAARKEDALRLAAAASGQPEEATWEAAVFFIEQVLFAPQADSYRILGTTSEANRSELRRNMVLLMQWLHPDRQAASIGRSDFDRTIFIHRVTQAWETLKSEERRAAYDQELRRKEQTNLRGGGRAASRARADQSRQPLKSRSKPTGGLGKDENMKRRFPRLTMFRIRQETLLSRLFCYFRERS